jgi:hypothetical protein
MNGISWPGAVQYHGRDYCTKAFMNPDEGKVTSLNAHAAGPQTTTAARHCRPKISSLLFKS